MGGGGGGEGGGLNKPNIREVRVTDLHFVQCRYLVVLGDRSRVRSSSSNLLETTTVPGQPTLRETSAAKSVVRPARSDAARRTGKASFHAV